MRSDIDQVYEKVQEHLLASAEVKRRVVDKCTAMALTPDTSFLTAFANDVGFEGVFERQVQALGKPGDVLVGSVRAAVRRIVARGLSDYYRKLLRR